MNSAFSDFPLVHTSDWSAAIVTLTRVQGPQPDESDGISASSGGRAGVTCSKRKRADPVNMSVFSNVFTFQHGWVRVTCSQCQEQGLKRADPVNTSVHAILANQHVQNRC